jgi:hypothetical protein
MAYHATVLTESSSDESSESHESAEVPSVPRPTKESSTEAQFYKLGDQFKLVLADGTTHQGTVTYESISGDAMHLTFQLTDVPS